jgi:hypothetical protein
MFIPDFMNICHMVHKPNWGQCDFITPTFSTPQTNRRHEQFRSRMHHQNHPAITQQLMKCRLKPNKQ